MNTIAHLLTVKARQRGLKRLPLYQAADEIGIHRVTLSKLVRQDVTQFDIETLVKLCEYFECEPGDILKLVELKEQVQRKALTDEPDSPVA
ncbi:MAG: helix-turn-helix transcriptional regulator [Chloroflexaceae bacterium]|nr:helix-turn-helix transcriptional regulator [Chloroflexaceae bacterium]